MDSVGWINGEIVGLMVVLLIRPDLDDRNRFIYFFYLCGFIYLHFFSFPLIYWLLFDFCSLFCVFDMSSDVSSCRLLLDLCVH